METQDVKMEEAPATPVGFRDAQLALGGAAEPETVTNDDSAAEPAQYLSEVLREACDCQLFLEWLKDTLPECDDTLYHHEAVFACSTQFCST